MMVNRLLLKPSKTEVIWYFSPRCQHFIPTGHVHINNTSITPVHFVGDLRVYIDTEATMRTNVIVTTRSCFAHTLLTLICALVVKFQSVLSTAALLVFSARRSYHITPLLRELH